MGRAWFGIAVLALMGLFAVQAWLPATHDSGPPAVPFATIGAQSDDEAPAPGHPGVPAETAYEAAAGPEPEGGVDLPVPPTAAPEPSARSAKKVGIQAGHWRSAELPDELASLRNSRGTAGGGVPEWRLNLEIANRVADLLRDEGVEVDVLPATVPTGYQADAFVALHADGNASAALSGYKLARPRRSTQPETDDALLTAIAEEYEAATGLRGDGEHVSRNMLGYYAFSSRRFEHAVSPATPSVILEMGFMTNRSDLALLLGSQDTVAEGIARGILRFLDLSR